MSRQTEIPGTERKVHPKVAKHGEAYADLISDRTKISTKIKDAKATLIHAMREAGETSYVDLEAKPPIVIDLSDEPKIKISKYKGKVDNDDEVKAKKKSKMRVVKGGDDGEADGDEMPN